MKIRYTVTIENPTTHIVRVEISAKTPSNKKIKFFLPSWSPGSYLMREYCKNIRSLKALNSKGEYLFFEQLAKGVWEVDWKKSEAKQTDEFSFSYEVYCHELTVRTSHVDEGHAFLHGPSYLMGVVGENLENPEIEFKFPPLWMKLHTALEDISESREKFVYRAKDYDELVDCPVEIGCHESDGFMAFGKEHHVIFYGDQYPHKENLKKDMQTIVETVASHFGGVPYNHYYFITHFVRGLYGGLEHCNSTALHFDGRKLANRMDYVFWLALVAHEYFHTWNVKRIRPKELGPFDYLNENYTSMHWLTEGLTSFMDELFVLRSGLCTLEEYLELQTNNLKKYYDTPGKKFHSLEDSSYNAWVKLYRPDENSNNSSISYYLKGGLVFSTLHFELKKKGKSINDLLTLLWERYQANPAEGVTRDEVLAMIEKLGGKEVANQFELRISTTEDIDFESYYKEIGMEFEWDQSEKPWLGLRYDYSGDRVIAKEVILDSPCYKAGVNAGDEILAINQLRYLKDDVAKTEEFLIPGNQYKMTIARLGRIYSVDVTVGLRPKLLKRIKIVDEVKAKKALL